MCHGLSMSWQAHEVIYSLIYWDICRELYIRRFTITFRTYRPLSWCRCDNFCNIVSSDIRATNGKNVESDCGFSTPELFGNIIVDDDFFFTSHSLRTMYIRLNSSCNSCLSPTRLSDACLNFFSRCQKCVLQMKNWSLAEQLLTFTFSEDFMISQKSINDFPKMYNLSFFGTATEQTKQVLLLCQVLRKLPC